jgi:hypothetical protein
VSNFNGLDRGEDSVFFAVFSGKYKVGFHKTPWFGLHFPDLSAGQVWVKHRGPFFSQQNQESIATHSGDVSRRIHTFPWFAPWFAHWMRLWARGNRWPPRFRHPQGRLNWLTNFSYIDTKSWLTEITHTRSIGDRGVPRDSTRGRISPLTLSWMGIGSAPWLHARPELKTVGYSVWAKRIHTANN